MKHNYNIVDIFQLPVVVLDADLVVLESNEKFAALFGNQIGVALHTLSQDFNEKKFTRKIAADQHYDCTIIPASKKRSQYSLTVQKHGDHYLGIAADSSAFAKYEAMLESYSALIDKQKREIEAKTEQLNLWRVRIERELEQAATVQELLVPRELKTDCIDSRCEHLQELSGDFHELARHDDGASTFIIGDVAGKGIYAAMMLAQTLTAFRASFHLPTLSEVAVNITAMLEDRFPDGLFVAFTLLRQSADKKTVHIMNLGNPDAILLNDDGVVDYIASIGPAIGIFPPSFYEGLEPSVYDLTDKRLYVFSDGIMDINQGDDIADFKSSEEIGAYIYQTYCSHPGDELDHIINVVRSHKQIDDVTICVLTTS